MGDPLGLRVGDKVTTGTSVVGGPVVGVVVNISVGKTVGCLVGLLETGEALGWPLTTVGSAVDGWPVGCSVVVGNIV